MIKVGDQMPQGTFMTMTKGGPQPLTSAELFKGKTVVLFGLPGAFTPTCSAKHVPSYVQNFDQLKAKGVDAVACMSVNDAFVMGAWGKHQGSEDKVQMLADGSAEYTRKLGLDLDLRSEEHTSELQSLMRISYAVFCLKKKKTPKKIKTHK